MSAEVDRLRLVKKRLPRPQYCQCGRYLYIDVKEEIFACVDPSCSFEKDRAKQRDDLKNVMGNFYWGYDD
jgi:hypothetical protein